MADEVVEIINTEITQTYELYILCLTLVKDGHPSETCYKLFNCDLENFQNGVI
jgi:hypothetical protein